MMLRNSRPRATLLAGLAVALVAAVGITVATAANTGPRRWVTAVASTGTVTQTFTLTGKVSRPDTTVARFAVDGSVESVRVRIGDRVTAGQVLASLAVEPLRLAVLNANSALARAESALDAARNPASASPTLPAGSAVVDRAALVAVTEAVGKAIAAETAACQPLLGPMSPASGAADGADPEACARARAAVATANAQLQAFTAAANRGGPIKPLKPKVSPARVAGAEADLLRAEQALGRASEDLAAAELTAPAAGTVAEVTLASGGAARAGAITIIGSGSGAAVEVELPLPARRLVQPGHEVQVTPAGATTALPGRITTIAGLATAGTEGDNPTYATKVLVDDPAAALASGSLAAVDIPARTASGVVVVPVSAVTPTGYRRGEVQVVSSADAPSAQTLAVGTGAVGGGLVEITTGLSPGQLVVLADRIEPLPTIRLGPPQNVGRSVPPAPNAATEKTSPTAEAGR